ncbi:hypothetical protein PG994_012071 [Apiospora phragmitis]|uniref:Uncharacterized protein n=1 Tax=Apiospora phragmitis TaxID=2905665 RepID=A0ABR1TUL7_9PEZI
MYHYIVALAVTAFSVPFAAAQIATQFQAPTIAFSYTSDCSDAGAASSMVAGVCTAIPDSLLAGASQSMNITYAIDNVLLNCPLTFYTDALCTEGADVQPYNGAEECVSVYNYKGAMAKCSNILTGATYKAPANSS